MAACCLQLNTSWQHSPGAGRHKRSAAQRQDAGFQYSTRVAHPFAAPLPLLQPFFDPVIGLIGSITYWPRKHCLDLVMFHTEWFAARSTAAARAGAHAAWADASTSSQLLAAPLPCAAVCVGLPSMMYSRVYKPTGYKQTAIKGINIFMVGADCGWCQPPWAVPRCAQQPPS